MRRARHLFRFAALGFAGALPHCTLTSEGYRPEAAIEQNGLNGGGAVGSGASTALPPPKVQSPPGTGAMGGFGGIVEPPPSEPDAAAGAGAGEACAPGDLTACDAAVAPPLDAACSGAECAEAGCIGDACAPPVLPEPPEPSCNDGEQNGGETGTDCGGPCEACGPGEGCIADADCESLACEGERCCGGQDVDCTRCALRLSGPVNCDTDGPEASPACTAFLECLAGAPEACPRRTVPGCSDVGGVCDHTAFGGNGSPGLTLADRILGSAQCDF